MRKRIIAPAQEGATSIDEKWLNVEELAEVEVTSEDPAYWGRRGDTSKRPMLVAVYRQKLSVNVHYGCSSPTDS